MNEYGKKKQLKNAKYIYELCFNKKYCTLLKNTVLKTAALATTVLKVFFYGM